MERIGIIGLGWLGKAFGKSMLEKGADVYGTTTSEEKANELKALGFNTILYKLGERIQLPTDLDFILINIPVKSTYAKKDFELLFTDIKKSISSTTKVIFTSSTSVYVNEQGITTEADGKIDENNLNYQLELLASTHFGEQLTRLRFGGLYGENRHPVHYLAGRTNMDNGQAPINLVHQKDIIRGLLKIGVSNQLGDVYNFCNPEHPMKGDYYKQKALELGLTPPSFNYSEKEFKTIDPSKFCSTFDFQFTQVL